MKDVRSWSKHSILKISGLVTLLALVSCNPMEITSSGMRQGQGGIGQQQPNKAYIYREGPMNAYPSDIDMSRYLDKRTPEFITEKSQLKSDCQLNIWSGSTTLSDCLYTYGTKTAGQTLLTRKVDGSWGFNINSNEFYQVNGHYHVRKGIETFFQKLNFAQSTLYNSFGNNGKPKAIPSDLSTTGLAWFKAIDPSNDNYFRNNFLSNYTLCNLEDNASFSPAGPELCFGYSSKFSGLLMVQDPSVIYHELGHALVSVMMNMRNATSNPFTFPPAIDYHSLRSNLGFTGYDEAGAINEGIADYFSFVMNKRKHIGEWALGRNMQASRPLSEDDSLHIHGIDTSSEGRLSYPNFLLYDPNHPNEPLEGVHFAGQIVSHYLVALTESFKSQCSLPEESSHDLSTSYVMFLLAETLAEIGDLKAKGGQLLSYQYSQPSSSFVNLDEFASYMWTQVIKPPTYRRFFQTFQKNIHKYVSNGFNGICPSFTKTASEKLLDDYGLLLFRNYHDNGVSTKDATVFNGSPATSTLVEEENRTKSTLIAKSNLTLATPNTEKDVAQYYLIDSRDEMNKILPFLLYKGFPYTSNGVADIKYNNGKTNISPGEIVAVIPNLFNSSSTPMAGVQIIAADWDHAKMEEASIPSAEGGTFKPYLLPNDVTTSGEGAVDLPTTGYPKTDYNRYVKNSPTTFNSNAVAPVCMVQLDDTNSASKWVSQNQFRLEKDGLNIEHHKCLGYGGTEHTEDFTFNPHECFVRVVPGANRAFYSRIDAQKSYVETMRENNPNHKFGVGNSIIFEVSQYTPPGTKFRCRLRATFGNCSDCFNDPNDPSKEFLDYEYNGHKPYKIINFEFTVND